MLFRKKKVEETVKEPELIVEEITLKTADEIVRAMALALSQSETPKMCYSIKVFSDGGQQVRLDDDTWYRRRPTDYWIHVSYKDGKLHERQMSWLEEKKI